MQSNPTSFYANLLVVSEALKRRYGLDTDALLEQAGINLAAIARGDQRVPFEAVEQFWKLAVTATGNPTIGLDVVHDFNPAVYKSVGVALLCSSTLRDFFERFERFFAVISTLETVSFEQHGDFARFTDENRVNYSSETMGCHCDAFAAFVVKFIRILYDPDYHPVKVALAWTPPEEYQSRYPEWFGCPVEFGQTQSSVFLDPADLDRKLPGANLEIAIHNDRLAVAVLEKMRALDLPTQVYSRLIEFLPTGNCSRAKVAYSLNMSESAFQKKLKAAGTSYQTLLDDVRSELAQHHLSQADISVDEVAYLLGFSDSSNFTRAFRRWLGVSPKEFRTNLAESEDDNPGS